MKMNNLNPVWNENFDFPLKSGQDDILHVEVWNFNPDETLKEKLSRKKEVKDWKSFGKLLKDIAVTSTTSGKPAHEFLGLFSVSLKGVPILGMERWFTLEGRDKKKVKNRGEVKLQLSLVMKNTELQTTFQESLEQYERLVKVFVDFELRYSPEWTGALGDSETNLLRLFGAQRGLRPAYMDLVYWCVLVEALQTRNLDYQLIWNILERSKRVLEDGSVPGELNTMFWKAVDSFVNTAMLIIRNITSVAAFSTSPEQLRSYLMCLKELVALDSTRRGNKLSSLDSSVKKAITLGAADFFSQIAGFRRAGGLISDEDNRIESCIHICQEIMADLKRALTVYNEMFLNTLNISYFAIIYEFYDSQLSAICKAVVESATRSLKSLDFDENCFHMTALEASGEVQGPDLTNGMKENHSGKILNPKMSMGTALFELYLLLQQFHKLSTILSGKEKDRLKVRSFHTWFSTAVGRWLSIALYKALVRIGKAVAMDPFVPVDNLVKHSNSAVDAVTIFYQIKTFWQDLSWPDAEGSLTFAMKIMDDICRCSTFYADVIDRKMQKMISNTGESKFSVTQQILCMIHDILLVRNSIRPLAEALDIRKLFLSLQQPTSAIDTVLDNAEENIDAKLDEMYFSIARRIESGVAKFLNVDLESPAAGSHRAELIEYLDKNLVSLNSQLETAVFDKILRIIGERVMQCILNAVNFDVENRKPPTYFKLWEDLLRILANFFYGTQHTEDEILSRIRKVIRNQSSETSQLIQLYCLERLRWKSGEENKYGTLSVRAIFVGESLLVEVLNARNLKATNAKASCDPYVKVQLMMVDKAPEVRKTKVQKNTLFPLYDETFTFKVPLNLQMNPDFFVLFRLKDHDSLVSGEFVAETHLEFQNIKRGSNATDLLKLDQVHLPFTKTTLKDSEYLQTLESRTWDKTAKEFVKKERKRINGK